ncbi:ABC transporter ATP-binding protein [Butyrivibrio sp. AE3004]|uniref:ABC transporter ATP-binding protein n=1 Tax=Butyrivibrio sp. AE3004 TaxID=1506994 RepID=UPI0004947896|nr:ABC transporter ATP-binding protein [Butyrivibrio sp. AE3004]
MVLLEGKNLSKSFRDRAGVTDALKDVSFVLGEGEVLGVVGESGSGKSTLFRIISGMIRPDSGSLFYKGSEYTGKGPADTGEFLQVIFQNAKSSFDPRMTMEKAILENGRGKKDREEILGLLKMVGLEERFLSAKASELSGGQCQRMSIARAFYSEARILLCDEISSALDVSTQARVIELLQKLKIDDGLSAIFISHDIALVSMICDRIMVMKDGRCVEQGDTVRVIQNPRDEYTKLLIDSAKKQSLA